MAVNMSDDPMIEMALPTYLDEEIRDLYRRIETEYPKSGYDDVNFERGLAFLVAIKNRMVPDIDYLFGDDANIIREIVDSIRKDFEFLQGSEYEEPIADDELAKFIQKLYVIIDRAMELEFFDDYLNPAVASVIEQHIKANVFKIALILINFDYSIEYNVPNTDPDKYDDAFLKQIIPIVEADMVVIYDHMQFELIPRSMMRYEMVDLGFAHIFRNILMLPIHFDKLADIVFSEYCFPYFHVYSTFENYMTRDEYRRMPYQPDNEDIRSSIRDLMYANLQEVCNYDEEFKWLISDEIATDIIDDIKHLLIFKTANDRYSRLDLLEIVHSVILNQYEKLINDEKKQLAKELFRNINRKIII